MAIQLGNFGNPKGITKDGITTGQANAAGLAVGMGANIAGNLAGNLIGDGYTSQAGNLFNTASQLAGAIPGPWGGIVAGGAALLGGLTNRAFGSKMNQQNIATVENNIAQLRGFNSNAGDFDQFMSEASSAPTSLNFSNSFIGKDGWFSHKARRRARALRQEQAFAAQGVENSLLNNVDNLIDNQYNMLEANYAAFGGHLNAHGADWTNGIKYIENGGTHEENPNDGVQMGIAPDGEPNLVEEGEVIFNDYVFSNRLNVPQAIRNKYKLRGKKDLTFAEAAKKLQKEAEEMPNDAIAKRGLIASMTRLQNAQEALKGVNEFNDLSQTYGLGGSMFFDEGGKIRITPSKKGTFTAAAKKHSMGVQEFASKVLANKDNYSPAMVKKANFARNAAKWHANGGHLFDGTRRSYLVNRSDNTSVVTPRYYGYLDRVPSTAYFRPATIGGPQRFSLWDIPYYRVPIQQQQDIDPKVGGVFSDSANNPMSMPEVAVKGKSSPSAFSTIYDGVVFQNSQPNQNGNTPKSTRSSASNNTQPSSSQIPSSNNNSSRTSGQRIPTSRNKSVVGRNVPQMNPSKDFGFDIGDYLQDIINLEDFYAPIPVLTAPPEKKAGFEKYTYTPTNWGALPDPESFPDYIKAQEETEEIVPPFKASPKTSSIKAETKPTSAPEEGTWVDNRIPPLFYAPAIGSGVQAFTDAMGWTNRPDYSSSRSLMNAASSVPTVRSTPIGDYIEYKPFDRLFYANQLGNQAAGTRRNILNTSGGNRGMAMAGILAADAAAQTKLGELFRQADEFNLTNRFKGAEFNRGTNQYNSQNSLAAQQANINVSKLKLNALQNALTMRDTERRLADSNKSTNLTNFLTNLGNVGLQQFNNRQFNILGRNNYWSRGIRNN